MVSRHCSEMKVKSESCSVMSDSLRPHVLYSPWNPPGQNTGVGSLSLLQGILPTQGSNPGLPHCRQIFLPAEQPGKPKNTGVSSHSLLLGMFPTQELNRGLLHYRRILYQLSYQESSEMKLSGFSVTEISRNILRIIFQ